MFLVRVVQKVSHYKTCIFAAYLQPKINRILPQVADSGCTHLKAQRWIGTDRHDVHTKSDKH